MNLRRSCLPPFQRAALRRAARHSTLSHAQPAVTAGFALGRVPESHVSLRLCCVFCSSCTTRFLCTLGNLLQPTSIKSTQAWLYLLKKGKGVTHCFCCRIQQRHLLQYFSSEEKSPEQGTIHSMIPFKRSRYTRGFILLTMKQVNCT